MNIFYASYVPYLNVKYNNEIKYVYVRLDARDLQ